MLFPLRHQKSSVLNDTKAFKGGDHRLLVQVKKFHPAVTCQEMLQPDKESCGRIVDNMPKNWLLKKFGHPWDTTAPNKLPISIRGRKNNRDTKLRMTLTVIYC